MPDDQPANGTSVLFLRGLVHHAVAMRRAVAGLILASALALGPFVWAIRPITDDEGRSCGGGVFSSTAADGSDDSYKDVCDGLRDAREQALQPAAVVAGLALLGCVGWVTFVAWERRDQLV
jgi:hypothetical protein